MRDQLRPVELVGKRRGLLQQQQRGPVLDGADMLHTAVGKPGDEREIEGLEGVVYTGVVLQPGDGLAVLAEDRVQVAGQLVGVGLAVEQGHLPPPHLAGNGFKLARDEREQVGADRVRGRKAVFALLAQLAHRQHGGVGHRQPSGGHHQRQFKTRLEIRLVEQGEYRAGAVGYQQAVQVLGIAVERAGAGQELDLQLVAPGAQGGGRQHDMLVAELEINCGAIAAQAEEAGGGTGEIELQGLCRRK